MIRNIFSPMRPTQGEHERRNTPANSKCCKKYQQCCSVS